jgi:hypothetical protein
MKNSSSSHSYVTLCAVATLGFIAAAVAHEAVGHGGMCAALGGHITLLTSVYFRCSEGGPLIAAAGPMMNLAAGVVCWAILRFSRRLTLLWRLFLVFTMAFNLFWGAGYFIFSGATDAGDWAWVLRDLALRPAGLWRGGMGALGIFLYYRAVALVAVALPRGTPLLWPYPMAGAVSCLAALFFSGAVIPAVFEAAKENFGTGIGLLFIAISRSRRDESPSAVMFVPGSRTWVLAAALVTVAFFATLGHGFTFPA